MEALREGAPEAINGDAEETAASPPLSPDMKNNSSCCPEVSEGGNNDAVASRETENVTEYHQDCKGMETRSSTTSEAPYDSELLHVEKAVQREQENTNLSAETPIDIRGTKHSDNEEVTGSSFKPAAGNLIPSTIPNLVTGDVLVKADNEETGPSDSEALLLGLPADSLHAMASFLTPNEFCSFALCSKSSARICREIFRRVRMHGFRCATEVVTAWSMNEQADAKELCALYVSSGVPIYPHSLGHSYHTLVWRMGIEAQEMRASSQSDDPSTSNAQHHNSTTDDVGDVTSRRPVDRFFVERYETRAREGLNYEISYLEEKSLYMLNAEKNANDANSFAQSISRQISTGPNRLLLRPPQAHGHVLMEDVARAEGQGRPLFRLLSTGNTTPNNNELLRRRATKANSPSDARDRGPRVVVKVHRHLLDQHLLGRSCVDDKDGMMTTSPVNLAADFFHPQFRLRSPSSSQGSMQQKCVTKFMSSDGFLSGEHLSDLHSQVVGPLPNMDMASLRHELGELLLDPVAGIMQARLRPADATYDYDSDEAQERHRGTNVPESIFEPTTDAVNESPANRRIPSSISQFATPTHPNIFVNVDLDVYSASSANRKSDFEQQGYWGSRSHLRARFSAYQLRLETLLAQHDSYGFDECMLDFWDEFLPQTASIHYYDRHTAVPRISNLQAFLTKPCPKAIGVVQCEIERIKIGSKKKGVNMKGRFFPTYEYRLFVRHRPVEAMDGVEPVRRDTVLMTAKNRGRKYFESSMPSSSSKKGANNYYLYVPQQEDIEQHYKSVNGQDTNMKSITNGASNFITPSNSNSLMGRLQSNFIGTEFQIFTQKTEKKDQYTKSPCSPLNQLINPTCASEDDYGYDSGVSSDNPSSSTRRRSRFGRLSLRRQGGAIPSEPAPLVDDHLRAKPLRRSRSSGDVNENARRTRTSRRAIANDSEGLDLQRQHLRQVEEEDGAITYTANLLGSRPRIMDVCIPKVSPDGVAGSEWRKYLEKCIPDTDGGSGNRMLHHLKLIQQRMENEEHGLIRSTQGENEAHDAGDYSPPDDFGLLALQNRPPWWNIELGSFVLNFGGRVSVASVKNFQLCHRTDQDYIMLQFGRIQGRHSFTMDFQHPLTAVQAFAIAISSLQSKISFG